MTYEKLLFLLTLAAWTRSRSLVFMLLISENIDVINNFTRYHDLLLPACLLAKGLNIFILIISFLNSV